MNDVSDRVSLTHSGYGVSPERIYSNTDHSFTSRNYQFDRLINQLQFQRTDVAADGGNPRRLSASQPQAASPSGQRFGCFVGVDRCREGRATGNHR